MHKVSNVPLTLCPVRVSSQVHRHFSWICHRTSLLQLGGY
jgi:hypothetical protein